MGQRVGGALRRRAPAVAGAAIVAKAAGGLSAPAAQAEYCPSQLTFDYDNPNHIGNAGEGINQIPQAGTLKLAFWPSGGDCNVAAVWEAPPYLIGVPAQEYVTLQEGQPPYGSQDWTTVGICTSLETISPSCATNVKTFQPTNQKFYAQAQLDFGGSSASSIPIKNVIAAFPGPSCGGGAPACAQ